MQIVMNSPSLQQRIIENPNPDLEPLRVCIRQYKDDQAHGLSSFPVAIDSQVPQSGVPELITGAGVEDINDAWNFLVCGITLRPRRSDISVVETPGDFGVIRKGLAVFAQRCVYPRKHRTAR